MAQHEADAAAERQSAQRLDEVACGTCRPYPARNGTRPLAATLRLARGGKSHVEREHQQERRLRPAERRNHVLQRSKQDQAYRKKGNLYMVSLHGG